MNQRLKKAVTFALRWGIAVVGIGLVISKISLRDRVTVLDVNNRPVEVRVDRSPDAQSPGYTIIEPSGHRRKVLPADLVNKPDPKETVLKDGRTVTVLATDLFEGADHTWRAGRLLIEDPQTHRGRWIDPSETRDGYRVRVPYPKVEIGLRRMTSNAEWWLLLAALVVFPVTFIVTAYRWHELLKALDIFIPSHRTFTLNMVGAFYNTFLPGSTGGDVLKAYYAARQTTHRTRAVMSVVIDRVIGLLALVVLGGVMAATQWRVPACRKIALGSAAIVAGTIAGLLVFYVPLLRRLTGLDFILKRLPAQKQVQNAIHVMEIFRRHWGLVLWSVIVSFPVHATTVTSAMFSGMAFHLPLSAGYYWAIVPVIVLAGSIPISVQGAGVMEYFAIKLTEHHGCTIIQAFALTMSIRSVQMLWNLTGGYFVLRGGYHAPTEAERHEVEEAAEGADDEEDEEVASPTSAQDSTVVTASPLFTPEP